MFFLPPLGVLACSRQAFSSVHAFCVNACAPANILDAQADLFLAPSMPSGLPLNGRQPAGLLMILHKFGVRNATLGQMAGKLLP